MQVHSEAEVARILPIARRLGVPVTFRAAGTSLSGQAITDSVLLKLSHTGKNFRRYEIHVRFSALALRPVVTRAACVVLYGVVEAKGADEDGVGQHTSACLGYQACVAF